MNQRRLDRATLAREFDERFREPREREREATVDFLAIRVAGTLYAVRSLEIVGIALTRKLTRLPTTTPGLVGLAGVRSQIVPVFALSAWLGGAVTENPRWLLLIGKSEPLGLGFEELAGYRRVRASEIVSEARRDGGEPSELVSFDLGRCPIISLATVLSAIHSGLQRTHKEP